MKSIYYPPEPHWLVDVRLISRAGLHVNTVLTRLLITLRLDPPDLLAPYPAFGLIGDRRGGCHITHPIRTLPEFHLVFVCSPTRVVSLHARIGQKLGIKH